jgi:carbamoyltransferase
VKKILGISAFYHDSAAALIIDGRIVAAAQEERFTRIKHTADFPRNAIKYCLEYSVTEINDLDAIVFYDKPLLKFERLLETYYEFAPRGFFSFLKAIPAWSREKLFLKKVIVDELKKIELFDRKRVKLLFPEHHLSHAGSAFYPSPFREAAILTVDGVGEWATASISLGKGKNITLLKEMKFPHSVGLLYSAFTYFLGFRVNSGEYKLMGLAPYGNPGSPRTVRFIEIIREKIIDIKDDGSVWLNPDYFRYATGLKMINEKKWEKLFGFPVRKPEMDIDEIHCDLACAIQIVIEEIILRMSREARRITGCEYLCMAGGVALNCVANGKLKEEKIFRDIYIQPAAGDAGGSLGAALVANHIYFEEERILTDKGDAMEGALLGPGYSDEEVLKVLKKYKASYSVPANTDCLCNEVAALISTGNTVAWFQGRMEFGPRSLGNRSILADSRDGEMQKKLNMKIKYRESFRPFAPSVLFEDSGLYFNSGEASPYMLFNTTVIKERRMPLPENFYDHDFWKRLYFVRSDIPAVTHLDYSSRIQTVHKEINPVFWKLINAFKEITSCSVIINTSFNVRGEPIVCTPDDAYICFMSCDLDYLVINNFILKKNDQPDFENPQRWRNRKFKPD